MSLTGAGGSASSNRSETSAIAQHPLDCIDPRRQARWPVAQMTTLPRFPAMDGALVLTVEPDSHYPDFLNPRIIFTGSTGELYVTHRHEIISWLRHFSTSPWQQSPRASQGGLRTSA